MSYTLTDGTTTFEETLFVATPPLAACQTVRQLSIYVYSSITIHIESRQGIELAVWNPIVDGWPLVRAVSSK